MRPHADDLHGVLSRVDLVHQTVLNIDAAGIGSFEIADQFLKRWRRLQRILLEDLDQPFRRCPKIPGDELFRVLLSLPGIVEPPAHQLSSVFDLLNGSRNPFRIDSRMPGIESR